MIHGTLSAYLRISFLVLLGGCTLNQRGDQEVAAVFARHAEIQSGQAEWYSRTAAARPKSTTQPATAPAPTPNPTALRDYIPLALNENPDILAARKTAYARAKRIPQVTALPDPMIATRTFSPNRPMMLADGNNVFVMSITQQLPNPEKLDRAGRVALEETRMALAELEQVRLRVIGDVKRAYFQLYILSKSIAITEDNRSLLRGMIDVTRSQVSSGKRSQDDLLRAQVEFSDLQRELIDLRQQRVATTATLNTLVSRRPDCPVSLPREFDVRTVDVQLDTLWTHACKANPELKRLEHQIERDRQSRKLAGLGYWPDFTVGVEWMAMEPRKEPQANRPQQAMAVQNGMMMPMTMMPMREQSMGDGGKDMFAIMAEMNLPIWVQKTDAAIKEAEYNLGASIDQYTSVKNMVVFRIQDALSRVKAQRELVIILRDTIIPQSKQAFELSRTAYATGTSDFLTLVNNWQNWLRFTIQYHRALGELERSIADLEQEIGEPMVQGS